MQNYPDGAKDLLSKYIKKIYKMVEGKAFENKLLIIESTTTAMQILGRFVGIEPYKIVASVFVYCRDARYQFISKEFEHCIEIAALAPDTFVTGLHRWCNALSSKLRHTEGGYLAFANFANQFSRLQHSANHPDIEQQVIWAYTDLICLMLSYMRPKKLDFSTALVGVRTDGTPLGAKDVLAPSIMLPWEFHCVNQGLMPPYDIQRYDIASRAQKYGYPGINDINGITKLNIENRISQNIRMAMLPYINEYTYDIPPAKMRTGDADDSDLLLLRDDVSLPALKDKLSSKRRRTLSTNGVLVEVEDPTEAIQTLLLKEIVYEDEVILLFKLTLADFGDWSGFYNTATQYFFSPLIESQHEDIKHFVEAFVLYFYAAAVLDDEYSDDSASTHFHNFIYDIGGKSFGKGGALRRTDGSEPEGYRPASGQRHDSEKYELRDRPINGFVRKLPDGQKASDEAKERAARMGYELADDETYVSPFIRGTFYLKFDTPPG